MFCKTASHPFFMAKGSCKRKETYIYPDFIAEIDVDYKKREISINKRDTFNTSIYDYELHKNKLYLRHRR
jgi:hypothetical protein